MCNAVFSWSCHVASEIFAASEKNDDDIQCLVSCAFILILKIKFLKLKLHVYICILEIRNQFFLCIIVVTENN